MRIMLDECITHGPAQTLISFFALQKPPIDAYFVPAYFSRTGMKDCEWPKQLPAGDAWYVITSDRDKKSKGKQKRIADGPPLYRILPDLKITAVYLNGTIQQATGEEKVRAVLYVWMEIQEFFQSAQPGSRALITKRGSREYRLFKNY